MFPNLFMEIIIENKRKRSKGLVTSPLSGFQICSEVFFSLIIYHMVILDGLIQWGYLVILKIAIGNSWKPFHYIIIIPFSTSSLSLKMLEKKKRKYKNLSVSRTKKMFLDEIKGIFHIFVRVLFRSNIKNSGYKLWETAQIAGTLFTAPCFIKFLNCESDVTSFIWFSN